MASSVASDGSEGSGGGAPTGAAGGDLTGTYPNPTLVATGPGAGAIGGAAKVMRSVTLDAQGRVTAATSTDLAAVTGLLKSTAGALAAATAGTDYSAGTSALSTGLLKSTTATGALSIADPTTEYLAPSTNRQSKIAAFADTLVAFTDPFELFDDELGNRWTESNVASGTRKKAGISAIELAATASANDVGAMLLGSNMGSAGFPLFVPGLTGAKFFVEFRMRLTTAIDAQAFALFGDDSILGWGARGPSSTGFWAARFDNGPTTLTSTIAIDNGTWHRFRVYRNGTTGFFQVDSETPVSSNNAFLSADARLMLRCGNGTTAAARKSEWDYVFVRAERP